MKDSFDSAVKGALKSLNISESASLVITDIIFLLILLAASLLIYFIIKKTAFSVVNKISVKTKKRWDSLISSKALQRAIKIIPALIIYSQLYLTPQIKGIAELILIVYISLMTYFTVSALLDAVNIIYENKYVGLEKKSITGFLTVAKIVFFVIILIIILSRLLGQSPVYIISGLSALSAITLLIFKDAILGMVAGFQISSNDLVRIGDWIEMPKYGADGFVISISLTFVKVRNFDYTITTIPAYSLVSDSFKNWRGMFKSGGRRIKRSIYIDAATVSFCSEQLLSQLYKIEYLKDYLKERQSEIAEHNKSKNIDTSVPVNGRRLTNLGVFRKYILNYLKNHPKIHKEMICMVRQLESGKNGIPLEIYTFTNDTMWVNYEEAMSDIFDHLFVVISYFGLRVFQEPSGGDIRALNSEAV
jgi:miniconductance mechanosensitive channel